jgi:aryl-alcohol dehydrogenase-like predicted oxidoreductase
MRLATDVSDEQTAAATVAAAAEAGVTVFDTAHVYGRTEGDLGGGERLLAGALRRSGAAASARIVTKGGMTRAGGAWVPDGRAKSILSDCEASLQALDGLPIDVYLIHAPDPRTPWRTSVRALARLLDEGMVRRVGVSNVNRHRLDEALELAPVAAVEVGLSLTDDRALRGGIVERCSDLGIAVIAHSPLGGARRAGGLARRSALVELAAAHGASPAEVALAWLLALSPAVVPIAGATRPETARSAARAAALTLTAEERASIGRTLGRRSGIVRPPDHAARDAGERPGPGGAAEHARELPSPPGAAGHARAVSRPLGAAEDADVVLIIGIPGAGKTRVAEEYVARGYVRLNRDERGGRLRELADSLDDELARGTGRLVLDNTFLSRAARSYAIDAARRHDVPIRCAWLDTPLAQAQVNLVERLLDLCGSLPTPEEVRELARRMQGVMLPTSQMRALRELEPPSQDEGFAGVEVLPFARAPADGRARAGVFIAAAALRAPGWERALAGGDPAAPHLVFDWNPGGSAEGLERAIAQLSAAICGPVQGALCPHEGGPPRCWCRPPLPGLALAFAREHRVDPARSVLIGTGPAHRTLAATLDARYLTGVSGLP